MNTIAQSCRSRGWTLAVAESASAGRLAARLAAESGASSFFEGGVIAYNIRQKVDVLGVHPLHAASVNCVSSRVACEMASGVRALFNTTIGVSITGYAEPDASGDVYCWVGFDIDGIVWAERVDDCGKFTDRVGAQQHFADSAVEGLDNYLISLK